MEDTAKKDEYIESITVEFDGLNNVENDSTGSDNNEENFTNKENQETLSSSELKEEIFPNSQGDVRMVPNFEVVMERFPDFDSHGNKTDSESNKDVFTNVKQDQIRSIEEMPLMSQESKELSICKSQPECVASSEEDKLDFSKMECPYTWEECKSKYTEMDWIGFLLCKLSKPSSNGWRLFNLELLLACMYGYEKNYSKALETLKSCKKNLDINADDTFFANVMDGLHHLIYAAVCHTHLLSGKMDEALDISSALPPAKELSRASQGAIWASKAYILCMFGDDEKKKALECIKMAIQLDPNDGTRRGSWYYLAGKIYTKIRLIDPRNKLPGKEEMDMYQRAVDKNPFPNHVVVLACLSGEAARGFKARCAFNWRKADSYHRLTMGMIKKAYTESELSLKDAVRIASELKRLPRSLRPSEIVKEYLEGPLKILNENFDQMLSCILNNSLEEDAAKNLEDIKDSAVNLIKLMVEMNCSPLPIYDKVFDTLGNPLLSKYSADLIIFFQLMKGEYYLSKKRSILMILKIWGKAIQLDPESPLLLSYPTQFLQTKEPLNIYNEIKEKVKILLGSKKISKENFLCIKNVLKLCEKE